MTQQKDIGLLPPPIKVSGTVVDQDGLPIPDVNIYYLGNSQVGAITDMNGEYYIQDVPSFETLVFSHVAASNTVKHFPYSTPKNVVLNLDNLLDEVPLDTPKTKTKTNYLPLIGIGLGVLVFLAIASKNEVIKPQKATL